MRTLQAVFAKILLLLVLAIPVARMADAQSNDRSRDDVASFVKSVGKMIYSLAWPTGGNRRRLCGRRPDASIMRNFEDINWTSTHSTIEGSTHEACRFLPKAHLLSCPAFPGGSVKPNSTQ